MITGLETFAVPAYLTFVGIKGCENKPPPRVRTQVQHEKVVYDTSKTHNHLAQFQIDTVSPYGSSVHTKVSGLMSGNINVSMSAKVGWSTHPLNKASCVWYEEIDITIKASPTIYIAQEHVGNRCRYNATLKHELRHVKVDQQLLAKYQRQFTYNVKKMAREVDVVGPIRSSDVDQARADMNEQIQRVIKYTLDEMKVERRKRQQAVDSKTEYDRLSKMCGGR